MAMTYEWKPDSRFNIGAQIAADRLSHIREQAGALTPRAVVDDAKDAQSPLHPCFEWNEAQAADKYRLTQARQLIGSLVVVQYNGEEVRRETRAFVHLSAETQRYEPITVVMSDPDMSAELLARLRGEIGRWRARLSAFEEFGGLVSKLDEVLVEMVTSKPARARRGAAGGDAATAG